MFTNIGRKIKGLAKVIFGINVAISIITGLIIMIQSDLSVYSEFNPIYLLIGLLIISLGIFIAWLSTILLYGFGELIYKTSGIYDILRNNNGTVIPVKATNIPKIEVTNGKSPEEENIISDKVEQ